MVSYTVAEGPGKDEPKELQVEHQSALGADSAVIEDGPAIPYKMSCRTLGAVLSLAIAWGSSTFAITGPNSTIGYVVAEYPLSAANASWIANSPLFCLVTLPAVVGAAGDRYGKRWFIIGGAFISMIGAIISGFASSLEMVIGGQTLTGIGGTALIVTVAVGMEIVPAKFRLAVVSEMAMINSTLDAFGGTFTCE